MGESQHDLFRITVGTEAETGRIAAAVGRVLASGDCVLLQGDLGAGKTAFARALIRSLAGDPDLIVPSPTFTLVQQYPFAAADDPGRSIWHMDLWRLESPDEIHELGFEEAISRHISVIEWPERLGGLLPARALWLGIKQRDDDTRLITLSEASVDGAAAWSERLDGCL